VEARVRALFIKERKGERSLSMPLVRAVDGGFLGDHHTGHSKRRQILLMFGNVLDELGVELGLIYENVVVDGLDVMALQEGQLLRLGGALVMVTVPCEPCIQMERVRKGLQDALDNRRGMFVKVVTPGTVRVGDVVEKTWQPSLEENSHK
jgi:MOSC domain-containing protein YiiM